MADQLWLMTRIREEEEVVLGCQEPVTVVAARRRFNAQRKTELNSTERSSSVEFSSVFRCALGLRHAMTKK